MAESSTTMTVNEWAEKFMPLELKESDILNLELTYKREVTHIPYFDWNRPIEQLYQEVHYDYPIIDAIFIIKDRESFNQQYINYQGNIYWISSVATGLYYGSSNESGTAHSSCVKSLTIHATCHNAHQHTQPKPKVEIIKLTL